MVAFTDGEANKGRTLEEFKTAYAQLPEDARKASLYSVFKDIRAYQ